MLRMHLKQIRSIKLQPGHRQTWPRRHDPTCRRIAKKQGRTFPELQRDERNSLLKLAEMTAGIHVCKQRHKHTTGGYWSMSFTYMPALIFAVISPTNLHCCGPSARHYGTRLLQKWFETRPTGIEQPNTFQGTSSRSWPTLEANFLRRNSGETKVRLRWKLDFGKICEKSNHLNGCTTYWFAFAETSLIKITFCNASFGFHNDRVTQKVGWIW